MGNRNYDIDAPEGSSGAHSQFISIKDWKVIGAVVLILFVVSIPIYREFKQARDEQVCRMNINGVYKAMMQYAASNNDLLPPLYVVGENGAPLLVDGKPFVWASLLGDYMNKRDSFKCPSASVDETMPANTFRRDAEPISLTYGMYVAMGAKPYQTLSQPSATALILETSNSGAERSFNPLPFKDLQGNVVPFDAFMAGYDDSNGPLTPQSKWITRLAFRGADKGYLDTRVTGRHRVGIHVVYVDGHLGKMAAPQAKVENLYPDATGMWRVR